MRPIKLLKYLANLCCTLMQVHLHRNPAHDNSKNGKPSVNTVTGAIELVFILLYSYFDKGALNPVFFCFFLHIIVAIPLNKKFSFFYDTFMHTFKDIHYFVTLSHYLKSLIYVMIGTRGCKMSKNTSLF